MAPPTGPNKMQNIGLALSNFADAADMFRGGRGGYAAQANNNLRQLQQQLLLQQQLDQKNAQASAVAQVAGGLDPSKTDAQGNPIVWDSGRQAPSGIVQTMINPDNVDPTDAAGIANSAPGAPPGFKPDPQFSVGRMDPAELATRTAKFDKSQQDALLSAFPEQVAAAQVKSLFETPELENYVNPKTGETKMGSARSAPAFAAQGFVKGKEYDPNSGQFKVGQTRDYQQGSQKITEQWDGKQWAPLGSGAAFAPQQPDSPGTGYERTPEGGARMIMGGPAAVARAGDIAKPVLDQKKVYTESATQYNKLADLAQDNTGTSDISLVYTFFKTEDPTSSVKEGEFDLVGQKMGLPSQIVSQLKQLQGGEGFLTPETRQQLVNTAGRGIKQRKQALQSAYKDAASALVSLGVDKNQFLPFSVKDVSLSEVKKEFPDAVEDTAGRVYVVRNGKKMYVEADE